MELISINSFEALDERGKDEYIAQWLSENSSFKFVNGLRACSLKDIPMLPDEYVEIVKHYFNASFSFCTFIRYRYLFIDKVLLEWSGGGEKFVMALREELPTTWFMRWEAGMQVDTEGSLENALAKAVEEDFGHPWYSGQFRRMGLRNLDAPLEIPGNSPLLTIDTSDVKIVKESNQRYSGAPWYEGITKKEVLLAGVGGIGSWVAFILSRMDLDKISMYDPDKVEMVNLAGQFYSKFQVKRYKVDAVAESLSDFSDYHRAIAMRSPYVEGSISKDIMICGFDNMAARKVFFNNWRRHVEGKDSVEGRKGCLFIDGRLAAEVMQVYCITGDNEWGIRDYENGLFSDNEADETVCSYKQTSYMANMIGGAIANLLANFICNLKEPYSRELPYFLEYDAALMDIKVRNHG